MSSGPKTGLAEITLPAMQNGSSIMPGKVNPVIPEVVSQVAFLVIGNDVTISMAAEGGQLELNAFEPIIFHSLFASIDYLCNGIAAFINCINTLTVDEDQCRENLEQSVWLATAVSPYIGYEAASKYAKKALREHKKVSEVLVEEKQFTKKEIDDILNNSMT